MYSFRNRNFSVLIVKLTDKRLPLDHFNTYFGFLQGFLDLSLISHVLADVEDVRNSADEVTSEVEIRNFGTFTDHTFK